jgi:hypothetical protein
MIAMQVGSIVDDMIDYLDIQMDDLVIDFMVNYMPTLGI